MYEIIKTKQMDEPYSENVSKGKSNNSLGKPVGRNSDILYSLSMLIIKSK